MHGGDNQVVAALLPREGEGLFSRGDAGQTGCVMKIELEELVQKQLVELTVFGKNERIVKARDQDDVLDPMTASNLGNRGIAPNATRVPWWAVRSPARWLLPQKIERGGITPPRSHSTRRRQPFFLNGSLVHHRVGNLEETGDVGAIHVVARSSEAFGSVDAGLWMLFMMPLSRLSTSSRVQESRRLFWDISSPDTDTPPALAALPGP